MATDLSSTSKSDCMISFLIDFTILGASVGFWRHRARTFVLTSASSILHCCTIPTLYTSTIAREVKIRSNDVMRKRCARVAWLHGLCPRACRVVTCRMVTWFVPVRVSRGWLHGLPIALALALALVLTRGAGSASFNAVAFQVF